MLNVSHDTLVSSWCVCICKHICLASHLRGSSCILAPLLDWIGLSPISIQDYTYMIVCFKNIWRIFPSVFGESCSPVFLYKCIINTYHPPEHSVHSPKIEKIMIVVIISCVHHHYLHKYSFVHSSDA